MITNTNSYRIVVQRKAAGYDMIYAANVSGSRWTDDLNRAYAYKAENAARFVAQHRDGHVAYVREVPVLSVVNVS